MHMYILYTILFESQGVFVYISVFASGKRRVKKKTNQVLLIWRASKKWANFFKASLQDKPVVSYCICS